MRYEVLPDPRALQPQDGADPQVLQIHRPIPERVPIGHFESRDGAVDEIVDEVVGRAEYLALIQQACARLGNGLRLRFFDHFEVGFDASVLDHLDEVRDLAIDGMEHVRSPEAVGRLPRLRSLLFGPWGKQAPKVLSALGVERLEHFTLAGTPNPRVDLAPLAAAQGLRTLRLLGRGKNTEAIGHCAALTELAMVPSDKFGLGFVGRLDRLEVLKLVLGNALSMEAIGTLPALRDLSLFEVHHLEELGNLQRFPRLRRLQLSDQPRIAALQVGPENTGLEHMRLYSVPGLATIRGLADLPALKSLWAYDSRLDPRWDALPRPLTHLHFLTKKMKGRDEHAAALRAAGFNPDVHPNSHFFYK